MKRIAKPVLSLALVLLASGAFGQLSFNRLPVRSQDHFIRHRIVNRVNLEEKINFPLIQALSMDIYNGEEFSENAGIVAALMNALQKGDFLALDPNNLTQSLTWDQVMTKSQDLCGEINPDENWETDPDNPFYFEETDEPGGRDGFIDEFDPNQSPEGSFESFTNSPFGNVSSDPKTNLAPFESVIEIIEDRIIDKNRSEAVYDIQYIRLVWVDPAESSPDQYFVTLKYDDVAKVLENTRWVNKHNDAEDRNLKEILELRLFSSYPINVSGRGVKTMEETYYRDQQLLEIEHHLWSF